MLRPFPMASAILLATATRGGNEGPFDPGIEGGDLANKPTSFGFECAMGCLHVRIVLLHYGNVKKKRGLFGKSPSEKFLNPTTLSYTSIDTLQSFLNPLTPRN